MRTALYRPLSLGAGVLGGVLAGVVFKQVWKMASGGDDAPDALDQDRGLAEVLIAAAVHGAVFALVKAAVDRSGAELVRRLTGTWPG